MQLARGQILDDCTQEILGKEQLAVSRSHFGRGAQLGLHPRDQDQDSTTHLMRWPKFGQDLLHSTHDWEGQFYPQCTGRWKHKFSPAQMP